MTDIPNSMKGKHDYQLQSELKQAMSEAGIECYASIERRRARIKVKYKECDFLLTRKVVVTMFPEFVINKVENGFIVFTAAIHF